MQAPCFAVIHHPLHEFPRSDFPTRSSSRSSECPLLAISTVFLRPGSMSHSASIPFELESSRNRFTFFLSSTGVVLQVQALGHDQENSLPVRSHSINIMKNSTVHGRAPGSSQSFILSFFSWPRTVSLLIYEEKKPSGSCDPDEAISQERRVRPSGQRGFTVSRA